MNLPVLEIQSVRTAAAITNHIRSVGGPEGVQYPSCGSGEGSRPAMCRQSGYREPKPTRHLTETARPQSSEIGVHTLSRALMLPSEISSR